MATRSKQLKVGDTYGLWTVIDIPEDTQVSTSYITVMCKCNSINKVLKAKLTGKYSNGCKSCMCKISKDKGLLPPKGFIRYKNTQMFVSKNGEVFSTKVGLIKLGTIMGGTSGEYYKVHIGAGKSNEYVHRMVATAYLPFEEGRWQVNHIDKNTLNNKLDNLEWVTPSENIRHAKGIVDYKS